MMSHDVETSLPEVPGLLVIPLLELSSHCLPGLCFLPGTQCHIFVCKCMFLACNEIKRSKKTTQATVFVGILFSVHKVNLKASFGNVLTPLYSSTKATFTTNYIHYNISCHLVGKSQQLLSKKD